MVRDLFAQIKKWCHFIFFIQGSDLFRRPAKGLLAGQWEFPSVALAPDGDFSDATARLSKVLTEELGCDAVVSRSLETEMNHSKASSTITSSSSTTSSSSKHGLCGPVVHLFSHQRHTMHIAVCRLQSWPTDTGGGAPSDSGGRTARWMNEAQMSEVGITTGMKKVLTLAKNTVR